MNGGDKRRQQQTQNSETNQRKTQNWKKTAIAQGEMLMAKAVTWQDGLAIQ